MKIGTKGYERSTTELRGEKLDFFFLSQVHIRNRGHVALSNVNARRNARYQTLKCFGQAVITRAPDMRVRAGAQTATETTKRQGGGGGEEGNARRQRLMKARRRYGRRELYARGLPRGSAYPPPHGKQSLARLSDVLILWKQFLRRCAADKDDDAAAVVVCTQRVRGSTGTRPRKTGECCCRRAALMDKWT